jgi:hypothetical protein
MRPLTTGSALRAFLQKQERGLTTTNICLDGFAGGPLCVRNQKELHSLLGDAISRGERFFMNEMRSDPFFALFFDVDLCAGQLGYMLTDLQLDTVITVFIERLRLQYPTAHESVFTAVVAGQQPGQKLSSKSANLHIHFPNLIVSSEEACAITTDLVPYLPPFHGITSSWHDALDLRVYGANGLRMLGSCKPEDCPAACKGLKTDCPHCENKGRINVGRVYMLRACYTRGTRNVDWLAALNANPAMAIKTVSIRNETAPQTSTGVRPNGSAPVPKTKKLNSVDLNGPAGHIQRAIQGLGKRYTKLVITKFTELKAGELMCVDVDGPGSKACPNLISGEHASSRVWFLVSSRGVMEKCRCKKATIQNRKMPCSQYKSKWMPLPPDVLAQLFPSHTAEKISSRTASIRLVGSKMNPATRLVFEHYQNMLHGEPTTAKKRKRAGRADERSNKKAKI